MSGKGEHKQAAVAITEWLRKQKLPLHDKWHISPFYATARLIPTLIDWDNEFATQCVESLLEYQQEDGGWGSRGASTPEETSYAVLGLASAWYAGLLDNTISLYRAKRYLADKTEPTQRLWISKVLYQPVGVVRSTLIAARYVLKLIVAKERIVA